jgi:hypothetical protein
MKFKTNPEIISIVILCAIIALASQNILTPYANFKNAFQIINEVPFSNIDLDEYNSAVYLSNTVDLKNNPNAYVVSDYSTSYLFRGMTGMNTSASRPPDVSIANWKIMQEDIKKLFGQSLRDSSFENLNNLSHVVDASSVYLVLSKRTCWWVEQKDVRAERHLPLPGGYTFEAYCLYIAKKFDSSPFFHKVYVNNGVRIYEYKQNG